MKVTCEVSRSSYVVRGVVALGAAATFLAEGEPVGARNFPVGFLSGEEDFFLPAVLPADGVFAATGVAPGTASFGKSCPVPASL